MWVIDTDVIVAALRSRAGASAALLRAILRGDVQIGLSVAMVLEYEAVATRDVHLVAAGLTAADVLVVIDALVSRAHPVVPHFRWRPLLRDPNDEMILETAVNAGASAIVTFNRRDFLPGVKGFAIDLLLPGPALEMLR